MSMMLVESEDEWEVLTLLGWHLSVSNSHSVESSVVDNHVLSEISEIEVGSIIGVGVESKGTSLWSNEHTLDSDEGLMTVIVSSVPESSSVHSSKTLHGWGAEVLDLVVVSESKSSVELSLLGNELSIWLGLLEVESLIGCLAWTSSSVGSGDPAGDFPSLLESGLWLDLSLLDELKEEVLLLLHGSDLSLDLVLEILHGGSALRELLSQFLKLLHELLDVSGEDVLGGLGVTQELGGLLQLEVVLGDLLGELSLVKATDGNALSST